MQKRAGCEAILQEGRLARCSSWPPPLESDWQWDGFRQLFGRATGRVNSFPRLKGGHLQNITSSPLGFASCVFHGSWMHNFQCLEMLWKGLQIYQQPDLLRRALYDFHHDICLKCQPGLAEPIFNVWFSENVDKNTEVRELKSHIHACMHALMSAFFPAPPPSHIHTGTWVQTSMYTCTHVRVCSKQVLANGNIYKAVQQSQRNAS